MNHKKNTESVLKEYLSIDDVAERLSLSRSTVERMIHSGKLPSARFGRSIRIPLSVVQMYEVKSLETPHMSKKERDNLISALFGQKASNNVA